MSTYNKYFNNTTFNTPMITLTKQNSIKDGLCWYKIVHLVVILIFLWLNMDISVSVSPQTFEAIQNVDINLLSTLSDEELRPILPCLVRMSLCAPLDSSERWTRERKKILQCLSGIEIVNSLVGLLSIDFHALEQDARKEQQLRYGTRRKCQS